MPSHALAPPHARSHARLPDAPQAEAQCKYYKDELSQYISSLKCDGVGVGASYWGGVSGGIAG